MAAVNKTQVVHSDLFEKLSNKLACLVYSRTDGDKDNLNRVLEDLNSLDFSLNCVKNNDRAVLVINQCCYLIPADEEQLVLKACYLFLNLLNKQQTTVEGKTLSFSISWCLECLKHAHNATVLNCLQALIRSNGKKIEKECNQIISSISEIMVKPASDAEDDCAQEIYYQCLKCIESLVCPDVQDKDKLSQEIVIASFNIFVSVLYGEKKLKNEIIHCKCLTAAMKGLENVILQLTDVSTDHLNSILGAVKGYMLYGLPGQDGYTIQKVFPSKMTIPEQLKSSQIRGANSKKLIGKYDRKSKKMPMTSISAVEETDDKFNGYVGFSEKQEMDLVPFKTSDSDYSDGELGQTAKIRSHKSRVRQCALILLGSVVRQTDPKLMSSYLPSFLPDGSQIPHTRTLITSLLKDPSPKCRSEVLGILSALISNSKHYLSQADSISRSSFTTFSSGIGNMIKELHRCLALALIAENLNTIITRILKCIADLIRCSPYYKLEPGLVMKMSRRVKVYLKHKDVHVQVSALTVFGCIISVEPKVQEVKDIVTNALHNTEEDVPSTGPSPEDEQENQNETFDGFDVFEEEESESTSVKPWLFEHCLRNLTNDDEDNKNGTNVAVIIETLQVLGALVRNFVYETVVGFPKDVIQVLDYCSLKSEYPIRLYAGKFMETVLNSLQFNLSDEDESKRASIPLVTLVWESLLNGAITRLMQSDDQPMLRSTGCNCIANIGVQISNAQPGSIQNSFIFDQLSRDKQIMCITHLFGGMRDESSAVRSCAARALAIFVLFPSLREDSLFFLDAIDATVSAASDEHSGVRSQIAWLLGNVSEAIVHNRDADVADGVTDEVILMLLKTGIKLSQDSTKIIKPGAVRGIGNLLRVVTSEFLKKYKDLVVDSLECLIKNASTGSFMKARWNSCYALGRVLQNPLICSNPEWISKIYSSMINLVQHYKNFKVRISASYVLSVPPARESYGDYYCSVWSAILNALENSKNVSDFHEYEHRDQLVVQLCLTMCHLVSVIQVQDLSPVQDVIVFHLDNLNHFFKRFQERIVPEKSSIVLNATSRVNALMDVKNLNNEQRNALAMLNGLFAND